MGVSRNQYVNDHERLYKCILVSILSYIVRIIIEFPTCIKTLRWLMLSKCTVNSFYNTFTDTIYFYIIEFLPYNIYQENQLKSSDIDILLKCA